MLKRIATAVVLIPVVLLLILRAPVPVLAIFAGIVALLTIHEFLKLTESYGVKPLRILTYIFTVIFFVLLGLNFGNDKPLLSTAVFVYCAGFAAALAPFIFLTRAMKNEDLSSGYPAAAASAFAFTYIALPMGMLVQLRQQWAGAFYLLYLLLVVWAGDVFAYFVGKSIGRHLMAPQDQSEENMGRRGGFGPRQCGCRLPAVPLRATHQFRAAARRTNPAPRWPFRVGAAGRSFQSFS